MWIVEEFDGVYKVCASKEIALREVVNKLQDFYKDNPNDIRELEDYRELMKQYTEPGREGFYIDEFCWAFKAEFIDK